MARQRTDLALEAHELWQQSTGKTTQLSGVKAEDHEVEGFAVHTVHILNEAGAAALDKPMGQYITLELDGSTVGTVTRPPYSFEFSAGQGVHQLKLRLFNSLGNQMECYAEESGILAGGYIEKI